ncbi:MAG: hypothetical protein JXB48_01200 [Candidatus Latescibacteria bacterium]|nr:hypothetical protein [Candidatus Latescibacterota bacterium]
MMTGFAIFILVGISLIGLFTGPRYYLVWNLSMIIMPLAMLIVAIFFIIRGYVITGDTLVVLRPGWSSKVDLNGLESVEADPRAMANSIRTFGNGGLFCYAGSFRNKKLGPYRAFATDQKRSVILRFSGHTVVVTPEKPEDFVSKLKEIRKLNQ